MDKKNFFVKKDDITDLEVYGQIFKFRRVSADDELNWLPEYSYEETKLNEKGEQVIYQKTDLAKLGKCKLRNIVELPFNNEELKEISGLNKDFKDYSNKEKDDLFGKLDPEVMTELIKQIDASRRNKKKD